MTELLQLSGPFVRYTFFASIAGLPAITVPAGKKSAGLPIGMQFVGKARRQPAKIGEGVAGRIRNDPDYY